MFRLDGERAVVTGAASGIGRAIAVLFAAAGAQVSLVDRDRAKLEETAAEIAGGGGGDAAVLPCDVTDAGAVEATFARLRETTGAATILVNSAGIAHVGNLGTTSPEDMDRLYAVNVRGTYLAMRAVLEPMVEARRGVMLNMASTAATSGIADRFAYSMTKGAVRAMTLSMAKDYLAQGIRCNCISPARVHTPFVDGFVAKNYPGREAEKMKELAAAQPIGRMGRVDEVAKLALYLCSDDAGFVTGVDYSIDGGFLNLR
ncbi:MAG TPA: SDR family oxidoreductase [Acidobacteriaceae bacterium]|nr:SDR family oxidoreductase [Acidobacteriaceae bacterium]